jgi:excinuclease ABC subunit C
MSLLRKVPGVYTLTSAGAPLHLSWSTNLERRLKRLFLSSYPGVGGDRGSLSRNIDSVECWPTGSRLELNLLLYRLAKKFYPDRYLKFLKLRMPWFVGLIADEFPRLEVTNRLSPRFSMAWGPFAARALAQDYEQSVLGLFQVRRCVDVLVPATNHPGCIYGEMNQCLRPCQCAVSASEYGVEAERVRDLLATNGRAPLAVLSAARDRACEELQFEQAALMHKRIDKIKATAALRDPVITEIQAFNGIALTRSATAGQFLLWPMRESFWLDPVPFFIDGKNLASGNSLDTQLRELLAHHLPKCRVSGNRTEELALFSRWYYSSWRDGEWFPFASLEGLNYRKLVRQLSRMAHPASALTG